MRLTSIVVPALVALSSSGCLQYVLVMGNPSQKAAAYHRTIDTAVGDSKEKKDCPRWIAGLNSIKEKLPVVSSGGTNSTWYGDAILSAYHQCTLEAVEDLKAGKGSGIERGKRAVERFDLVLSLPLEKLKVEDQNMRGYAKVEVRPGKEALRALRAETVAHVERLEAAHAAKVARENKRVELAKAAEAKGWTLAALAAWLTVDPLDDAMTKAQQAAITRLEASAQRAVAVPVALVAAKVDGVPAAVLEQVRASTTLTSKPTLRLVDPGTPGAVQVELVVGKPGKSTEKSTLNFEHTYISGSKMVPNPEIASLQKDIARHDKEAEWNRKGAESACKGQKGRCQTKEIKYKEAERHREKAQKARQDLARAKPTVRQDVRSAFPYTADKTVFTATAPVAVAVLAPGSSQPAKQSGTAKVERSTVVYPGNPKVGLSGRADKAPTPEELDAALATESARLLALGAAAAPAQAAGEFDAKAAAATEPLEKLQYALVRALRSSTAGDIKAADDLTVAVLETKVNGKQLMRALAQGARMPVPEPEVAATPAADAASTPGAAATTEAAPATDAAAEPTPEAAPPAGATPTEPAPAAPAADEPASAPAAMP